MIRFLRFTTRLGALLAAARDGAIVGIWYEGGRHAPRPGPDWREDRACPLLRACAREVAEYCEGRRRGFDLPVAARGTPFQRAVWDAIARIPYGRTLAYAALAREAGAPGAARAAGAATGRNPLSIVVPCHRVVGGDGALTGYAGGIERKRALLALERRGPA